MRRAFWTVIGLAWFLPGNAMRLTGASIMGAAIIMGGGTIWLLCCQGKQGVAAFDLTIALLALFAGAVMRAASLTISGSIREHARGLMTRWGG